MFEEINLETQRTFSRSTKDNPKRRLCKHCSRGDCPRRRLSKGQLSMGQFSKETFVQGRLLSKGQFSKETFVQGRLLPKRTNTYIYVQGTFVTEIKK